MCDDNLTAVDITDTVAYHDVREEFNNDIIETVEDYFGEEFDGKNEKMEEAARAVEDTIKIKATIDLGILYKMSFDKGDD